MSGRRPLTAIRRRTHRPVLSVVIPVYGVRAWLPAVLDSVLGQDLGEHGELEVVAVDDSSVDGSWDVLRDYARRDHRVRLVRQPNAGQGVARDNGVTKARGEFLTFVDGDDVIPPGAFAHMVDTLRASGSDFCVGDVRRFRHGTSTPTAWSRVVHRRDRIGVSIEEFPEALFDIIACNRMFRTAFWREHAVPFRARIPFQDHVPMLAAYVRAERFDVLSRVTYHWRNREDRTSTSQQKARLTTLRHRIDVKRDAWDLLVAEASETVQGSWLARTLEVDFPPFVPHGIAGDADYRTDLQALYRTYLDLARERPAERALDRVTARQKVRAHLVADGRWTDVAQADAWFDETGALPPARADGDAVVLDAPSGAAWLDGLPGTALRLSVLETNAEGGLLRVARAGDALVLTGWAMVRGLTAPPGPTVLAWLDGGPDEWIDLAVEPVDLPEANLWGRQRHADQTHAGFTATVPFDALPDRAATWALRVETSYAGVTRSGPVLHRLPRTSASRATVLPGLATRWDPAEGFVLDVTPGSPAPPVEPGPRVAGASYADGVVTLHLTGGGVHELSIDGPERQAPDLAVDASFVGALPLRLPGARATAVVGVLDDGGVVIDVEPPLEPSAWGASGRQRLQDGFAARTPELTDSVVLLPGRQQEALAVALARTDLTTHWVVPDLFTPVPDGCRPLLARSEAQLAALAGARLVVSDGPLGAWFVRRPGRRHLQTGTAHVWAAVGRDRWRLEGLTPARIERELARVARDWDVVLAASEEDAERLRAQYAEGLDVLAAGTPLSDLMLGARDDRSGGGVAREDSGLADLLGADVAVLGTGGLRFDWAVSHRPMVFHVPDLDAELDALDPREPWAATAPGPVVRDGEEEAAALGDLEALRTTYAEAVRSFDARANPYADGHAGERIIAALLP